MVGRERNCVTRVSKHGCVFDGEVDGFVTNMFLIGVCCEELFVGVADTGWGVCEGPVECEGFVVYKVFCDGFVFG